MTGLDPERPDDEVRREAARLAILDSYNILDTPAEPGFDDVVLLASQLCDTPIALVSFVAATRQWFKARVGADLCETPLVQSVCVHTLRQPGVLVIPDLLADPRTAANTLVTEPPHIRFYAGARLQTPEGEAIGALCVIDMQPRPEGLKPVQAQALEALARQVMVQLELRRTTATLEARVAERAQALARAEDALRQSQKMEAVGQLTGGLAHDFNNLLAGISGSLELLGTRIAQRRLSEAERYIAAAQGAAKRAAALTHRLLAFSRRQTLDPRPTDLNSLVAGMEDLVRRTAGPEITVETVGPDGLWSTLVDAGQLENALLNLCINARDAMRDGGTLAIATSNLVLDGDAARERDLPPGEYVALRVGDTGTGMAPEIAARAFDPFFTTKPIGMGTGLGLSMVYGFVRQSGGQAWIESEPGRGTTVCLCLPRHTQDLPAAANADTDADAPAIPYRGRGETVLVVDDEPTVRDMVSDLLEERGYAVVASPDGRSALAILQSGVPVDLLLTDVGMPGGMNGRQLADAARALRPGLRVLFMTGYAENAVLNHGHLEPGMRIVLKPFTMDALAGHVQDTLAFPPVPPPR